MACNNEKRFKETDKGEEFIKRGMTLITEPESDYYLNKSKELKRKEFSYDDGNFGESGSDDSTESDLQ